MLVTKLTCPHCQAVLKSAKPVPAGKQITCPKCQKPFAVTADMPRNSSGESHTGSSHYLPGSQAGTQNVPADVEPLTRLAGSANGLQSVPRVTVAPMPSSSSHAGLQKAPVDVEPVTQLGGSANGLKAVPRVTVAPLSPPAPRAVAAGPPRASAPTSSAFAGDDAPLVNVRSPRKKSNAGLIVAFTGLFLLVGGGVVLAIVLLSGDGSDKKFVSNKEKEKDKTTTTGAKVDFNLDKKLPKVDTNTGKQRDVKKNDAPKKEVDKESPDYLKYVSEKEQKKIDAAVERGVQYLLKTAPAEGKWRDLAPTEEGTKRHEVGWAALPALALLECKVKPSHEVIQQAAAYIRVRKDKISDTYSVGLAVVFLDRLGDPQDKPLIKTLAMRLVAGQTPAGGWVYDCPILNEADERALYNFMTTNKPKFEFLNPIQGKTSSSSRKSTPNEFVSFISQEPVQLVNEKPPEFAIVAYKRNKDKKVKLEGDRADNSNTQFAILGLWAARRHYVPSELSLEMAGQRFRQLQAPDGGWSYAPPRFDETGKILYNPTKNTMLGVGLLGLAMGHGAAAEALVEAKTKGKINRPPLEDAHIQNGLEGLANYINKEDDNLRGLESRLDLYYLWTLERVGMLYHQKNFGKRDWYRWGAEILLDKQNNDGGWQVHYHSTIDTSFALLFLKRSNLVSDLTQNLQFYIAIPKK